MGMSDFQIESAKRKQLADLLALQQDNNDPRVTFDTGQEQPTLSNLFRQQDPAIYDSNRSLSVSYADPNKPEIQSPAPLGQGNWDNRVVDNQTGRVQHLQSVPEVQGVNRSVNQIEIPGYGKGYYLKGDSTRAVLANGQIIDLGRDTTAERARNKENLALDSTRANIAQTQAQTVIANRTPDQAEEFELAKDKAKQQALNAGLTGTPNASVTGEDALANVPPNIAAQVKAIADGRLAVPGSFALKSPYWQQMLGLVSQYDPSFDMVNYNARSKTRNDFTSGKSAENIKSLNTAIGHLDTLSKNYDTLGNTDFPSYNTMGNWIGNKAGDTKLQSAIGGFDTSKLAVAAEMAKVFRSVGMSQREIKDWEERISTSASPSEFKATVKTAADLMQSRLDAIGDQYSKGMGKTTQGLDLLSPDAKKTFEGIRGGARENLTSADSDAMAWAMQNPSDPRAMKIKERLGVR